MNYKDLFHRIVLLISSPASAWEEIRLEEDRRKVFSSFVYPMIGLCGLSVFLGSLFSHGWGGPESFRYAMTQCCAIAVALFGGYFLASNLIHHYTTRMMGLQAEKSLILQLAGYSMVVIFCLRIILALMPDFQIIALLLQFYTVYIVWEGSERLMQIGEESRLKFTLVSSVALLFSPVIIEWIFDKLTYLLN
ncbi:MAG: Yip1 family protein [Bacteroides sp.]